MHDTLKRENKYNLKKNLEIAVICHGMKQTKQRFPAPTSKIIYIYIAHEKVEKSKKTLRLM